VQTEKGALQHGVLRKMFGIRGIAFALSGIALMGCQAPGENLKANVYRSDQVNTAQQATIANILAVLPAKIEADNAQQKQAAQLAGGLLGGIAGGVAGSHLASYNRVGGAALGAVGGGTVGVLAGSLVPDKVLVEGVSITYEINGMTLNSAQVGRLCEYVPGKAVVVSTGPTETRIQPNAVCPAKAT
jgi:outer membrane lipoprotein SlyB